MAGLDSKLVCDETWRETAAARHRRQTVALLGYVGSLNNVTDAAGETKVRNSFSTTYHLRPASKEEHLEKPTHFFSQTFYNTRMC